MPLAACRAAATQITNVPKLLQHLRTLARCLAFRQLLARALASEGVQALPQVIQEMSLASACLTGDLQGRLRVHICDTVGLPRPQGGVDTLLCSVSAAMQQCMQDNGAQPDPAACQTDVWLDLSSWIAVIVAACMI